MPLIEGELSIRQRVDYALQVPLGEGPWPLLLLLHGFGQTALEFLRPFLPLAKRGILVAAPQAPHQFYLNLQERRVGFSWLTRYRRDRSVADFAVYMKEFYQLLRQRYPLAPRVTVLGFSQGVSMAYRLWLYSGIPVGGIVACGGDLPPDVEEQLSSRRPLPVLLVHGRGDQQVPLEKGREALRRLRAHSYPAQLALYPGGHRIPSRLWRRLERFVGNVAWGRQGEDQGLSGA